MAETKSETVFAVMLYPPIGRPRVVELQEFKPARIVYQLATFPNRAKADAALKKFLTENPAYRRWLDGRIIDEPVAKADGRSA